MPILIIEHSGKRLAAVLRGAVVIGRESVHALPIDDRNVSRRHAHIRLSRLGFVIKDLESRNGTFVNGQRLAESHTLQDGDEIAIGEARVRYLSADSLPDGIESAELIASGVLIKRWDDQLLVDCSCGQPVQINVAEAGSVVQCRFCRQMLLMPQATARVETLCGVCQWVIADAEARTACPECGLMFHSECWEHNHGCSAYGCGQVNALSPREEAVKTLPDATEDDLEPSGKLPWDHLLLAASAFGLVMSTLAFGAPSLLVGGGALTYMRRKSEYRKVPVMISVALSVIGVGAGLTISSFWWLHRPPWRML